MEQYGHSDEVRVTNEVTGGQKGQKLARHDLVPTRPQTELARVYGLGARKYEDRNWEKGYDWSLSYAAAMRHLIAFWGGEDLDPELGTSHLMNAAFHLFALEEFRHTHPELDNRPMSPGKFTYTFTDAQQIPYPSSSTPSS